MQSGSALFPCTFRIKTRGTERPGSLVFFGQFYLFSCMDLSCVGKIYRKSKEGPAIFPIMEFARLPSIAGWLLPRSWCVNSENPYLDPKIWRLTAKFVNPISRHEIFVPRYEICVWNAVLGFCDHERCFSAAHLGFQVWNGFWVGEPMQGENMLEEHFDLTPERVKERLASVHCCWDARKWTNNMSLSWSNLLFWKSDSNRFQIILWHGGFFLFHQGFFNRFRVGNRSTHRSSWWRAWVVSVWPVQI